MRNFFGILYNHRMQKKTNFCDSRYIRKFLKLELSLETFLTKVIIFTLLIIKLTDKYNESEKGYSYGC